MAQEIDDAAVLAHLKARRAALDAAIAGYEAYLGQAPLPEGLASGQSAGIQSNEPDQLGPGVFHGMSVSEAAKRFLQIVKKKQKTRTICDALQQGGIESDAKNFYGNVYTTLDRTKDFIKLGKYWALAEWYPTRASITPNRPSQPKRRRALKGRRRGGKPPTGAAPARETGVAGGAGVETA